MKLLKSQVNGGLVRIGQQVIELTDENATKDEFAPRFILSALQDEVHYLSQTHLGMTKYSALRTAMHQNKNGTQAFPRCILCPWSQIQKFSEDALGQAVRNLLEFGGVNLNISTGPYIDQLDAILAVNREVCFLPF